MHPWDFRRLSHSTLGQVVVLAVRELILVLYDLSVVRYSASAFIHRGCQFLSVGGTTMMNGSPNY